VTSNGRYKRGVASGMRSTFQNSGTALSIGVFFSLMIAGLAASLPSTLTAGLRGQGVPAGVAVSVAHLHGLVIVFGAAACMAAIAALASLLRGRRYFHDDQASPRQEAPTQVGRVAR
jgi:hypothetical protein